MNDHSRDLFEDDSDCSSLNPVETSTPVRSVPPTMPGLATAISPTRPGFKRSKKHHLKEKRRQYRIKNMLSKKHQLSEASSHQVSSKPILIFHLTILGTGTRCCSQQGPWVLHLFIIYYNFHR